MRARGTALRHEGIAFETERVPLSTAPDKRAAIVDLTGQPLVPVLVEADGSATHDSKRIVERIAVIAPRS